MGLKQFTFFILFVFFTCFCKAENNTSFPALYSGNTSALIFEEQVILQSSEFIQYNNAGLPNEVLKKIIDKIKQRKKIISAVLAFPLPFGIIGCHRIYLGSKPYVPLVYIGTLGGAFGILPFIDFVVLVLDKDISRFENNEKVFMWVK